VKTLGDGSERASLVYIYSRQDEATDITGAWGCWLGQREWVGSLWLVDSVTNLLTMVCHFFFEFLNYFNIAARRPTRRYRSVWLQGWGYSSTSLRFSTHHLTLLVFGCDVRFKCKWLCRLSSLFTDASNHESLTFRHSTTPQKLDHSIMGPISKCGGSRLNRCHSFYCVEYIKLYKLILIK
jgi:hypothetical protein